MELPKDLPELDEPYYVLSAPFWMQWPMMAIVLFAPPVGLIWLYIQYSSGEPALHDYLLAAICLGMALGLLNPNFFRKWARFVVDRKGIYLGDGQYKFTFVPWSDVGELTIEHLSGGRKGVLIELKVSEEIWRRIYPLYVMYGLPKVKKFPIQNTGYRAEGILENIERIRRFANAETSGK